MTWTIENSTATGTTIDTKGNVIVGTTAGDFTVKAVAQFGTAASSKKVTATLTFTAV